MASKRRIRRKCREKRSYSDLHAAVMVIKRMEASGALGLRTYRCSVCKSIHIGHQRNLVRLDLERKLAAI